MDTPSTTVSAKTPFADTLFGSDKHGLDDSEKNDLSSHRDSDHTRDDSDQASVCPPDTMHGWAMVLCCFFLMMTVIGPTNSFGVYLQEYHTRVFPSTPTTTLSWIGCLQFGSMCMFGILAGVLVERFDLRVVVTGGTVVAGGAFLVASACSSPIGLLFTQGILFGAGGSCILNTAVSLPGQWMDRHRAVATGLAIAGGSLGALWLSFATTAMVANIGWQWSLRVTGLFILVAGLMVAPFLRKRVKVPPRSKIIDLAALSNMQFIVLFFSTLFVSGGYFMPYYFMPSYAVVGLGLPSKWSANISSILNAGSIVGRVATGVLADKIGPLNAFLITSVLSVASVLAIWLPFHSKAALIVAALLFGFNSGSAVSLVPVVTARIFGIGRLASVLGLLFVSYAIGTFLCSPIGGILLDKYGGGEDFLSLILYGGAFFALGTLLMLFLRLNMSKKVFVVV
ncbi:hypothetical protein FB645_002736 [Coemansia sp. IMI 203386]|nr:hypothetical protein FB645_002736 [Coemansia sp. IMI 203386]